MPLTTQVITAIKSTMPTYLAIFDLDETLIAADSASLWNNFIVAKGLAPASLLAQEQAMMTAYSKGTLDMDSYMATTLAPLKGKSQQQIKPLVDEFIANIITPAIYQQALERIEWHRKRGDHILIISATSEHLVKPIATALGINNVIAINLEQNHGVYTGATTGILSFKEGKVERLKMWLQQQNHTYKGSYGYSDSANDLPLLNVVNKPFAVNPDPTLAMHAQMNEWTIMDWRHENNILR
ncbi:HAD family hydrolase [Photobacterium aquimaris]|uniref:Haloacid dehalogenase-like hydrolase n=1 Tax=Photobacterium aquimaris TaxID=512643 RepID=A0A1Y6KUW6_9GAMM|nr:HAD family hydrolase [Photobacterium aquimaris]SMY15842.1 haloacid dehalogenase-like hydrolase [Photobacterium aquimaris]